MTMRELEHTRLCDHFLCGENFCKDCDLTYPDCLTLQEDLEGDREVVGGIHRVDVVTHLCPECGR